MSESSQPLCRYYVNLKRGGNERGGSALPLSGTRAAEACKSQGQSVQRPTGEGKRPKFEVARSPGSIIL